MKPTDPQYNAQRAHLSNAAFRAKDFQNTEDTNRREGLRKEEELYLLLEKQYKWSVNEAIYDNWVAQHAFSVLFNNYWLSTHSCCSSVEEPGQVDVFSFIRLSLAQ